MPTRSSSRAASAPIANTSASTNATSLEPGTAFPLVRGLLAVNERAGERLVEVIILSRNDADTSMRVLRSVEAHGLDITRGVFRGGRDTYPLLHAMSCDVFLSAEPSQVLKAREQGVAAAFILPSARFANDDLTEVRIAFDGDAVCVDAASQLVYDSEGLDAFHQHEADHADEPMSPGPFRPFLQGLARIGSRFGATSPIRTALVTARAAPAHFRVINTLRSWGVNVDETYFLGGVDKAEVLKAFGAHIFFDDQRVHAESAAALVPAAQVLWSGSGASRRHRSGMHPPSSAGGHRGRLRSRPNPPGPPRQPRFGGHTRRPSWLTLVEPRVRWAHAHRLEPNAEARSRRRAAHRPGEHIGSRREVGHAQ